MSGFGWLVIAVSSGVFLVSGGYTLIPHQLYDPACNIKGNISINSREKIYHVPGQSFYDDTVISPQYGERWFCTEAEARTAGWRRAYR